jgi:hypothetical protein
LEDSENERAAQNPTHSSTPIGKSLQGICQEKLANASLSARTAA